jgi:replicative DNA helicase
MTATPIPFPAESALELALLGHCLRQPDTLDRADVSAALLHIAPHPTAFGVLQRLRGAGDAIDAITAGQAFASAGIVQGMSLAASALLAAEDTLLAHLLPPLTHLARRREKRRVGEALLREAADAGPEDIETLGTLADRLADLATFAPARRAELSSVVALQEYVAQATGTDTAPPLPTGFASLDALLTGLYRGQIAVLAARPSVGKSALAQQVCRAVAVAGGRVLLATPEMSRYEVVERMLAQQSGLSTMALRPRPLPPWTRDQVLQQATTWPAFDLHDDPEPQVAHLRAIVARAAARQRPYDLVILDHLGWLADQRERGESLADAIGRRMKALKAMARHAGCALLAVCQLNRASEEGDKMRRPGLAELRSSGEIEQDADVVLLLHRETRLATEGEVIVAKQRNGPTGCVRLAWDGRSTRWEARAA